MTHDPMHPRWEEVEPSQASTDLFRKLDSLIEKHQGRTTGHSTEALPTLNEPVDEGTAPPEVGIPVLQDVVHSPEDPQLHFLALLVEARRQLQVALYLRLRQHLDRELEAALGDDTRLGAIAIDPPFSRVTQELRALLPIVVRESVEQVFGQEWLEMLLARQADKDGERS